MTNYTDKDIEKLKQALVAPLKEELDRDWEDETPEQIITIARNGIYWRTIANKNAIQQATVAIEAAARLRCHHCGGSNSLKYDEVRKVWVHHWFYHPTSPADCEASDIRALAPSGTANALDELRQPQLDASLTAAYERCVEILQSIIDIGKRDTSNPKYDGYYVTARNALHEIRARKVVATATPIHVEQREVGEK